MSTLTKKFSFFTLTITLLAFLAQLNSIQARYIPYQEADRRQDMDDDEMDSHASAPYQNQGEGQPADGYEDNEADGPYEETPREQEGQADLERFFDDHLGASERDGMDKENLPTNWAPIILDAPRAAYETQNKPTVVLLPGSNLLKNPVVGPSYSPVKVESELIELPGKNLIRHIASEPIESTVNQQAVGDTLTPTGSEIVVTENDDDDPVYVTKATNKPFRIAALNGYDPEEDFKHASQDIEGSVNHNDRKRNSRQSKRNDRQPPTRDITFNDPETETMFEDASETDEVTFHQDDPYQTDLEAEMRNQAYDRVGKFDANANAEPSDNQDQDEEPSPSPSNARRSKNDNNDSDDSDSDAWVNDGVDDMEIPSQSHQNMVLEKAAQQEAAKIAAEEAAAAAATAKQETPQQEEQPQGDGEESQRMPNADYLKNDLNMNGDLDDDLR